MKVAIDTGPLSSGDRFRGIGFHTKELSNELKKIKNKKIKIDFVDFSKTDLSKYDVVHYQYFRPHEPTLPILKPAKKVVVTIHDLIRLIYPNAYPPGIRGSLNFILQKINLRNVDAIITISETSKKDIVRFLNFPQEKIFVTYLGPQTESKTTSDKIPDLPREFVLYVGDVNYNKNLLNLAIGVKLANLKLVMVGKQTAIEEKNENIENRPWNEFLKLYARDEDIIRLGFVNDINQVYKKASVYCQPSLYEGFGMTILEAFKNNLPVAASKTQALVEIGDDACLYFDPNNPKEISEKLKLIINNKKVRNSLIAKGRRRLQDFSWKKCAEETLKVYEKI